MVYTRADIEKGRQVWQSMGGMQLGSIWGHGGYVAPDWSADWLHREALAWLDMWARAEAARRRTRSLPAGRAGRGGVRGCSSEMRANTYDAATGTITVSNDRAAAMSNVAAHYEKPVRQRPGHARAARGLRDEERHGARCRASRALTAFFWWTAWSAVDRATRAQRHHTTPTTGRSEPLVGNTPPQPIVDVVGLQRAVPDRRHRPARLAPRASQATKTRCRCRPAIRSPRCASRRRCAPPRKYSGWCWRCS